MQMYIIDIEHLLPYMNIIISSYHYHFTYYRHHYFLLWVGTYNAGL